MSRPSRSAPRALGNLLLVAGLAAGCSDAPTRPLASGTPPAGPPVRTDVLRLTCTVVTQTRTMTCGAAATAPVTSADRIIGGQDTYVRLASTSSAYDAGTQTFQTGVTVQNLVQSEVGTPDGSTVEGVTVFLESDPVTVEGTGTVTVANADGRGTFTGADQPYWLYNQILEPYEISTVRTWVFSVPTTVLRFTFTAYVSAPMVNEAAPLLDAVWTGATSTAWSSAGNWAQGAVPGTGSVVAIPSDALLASTNYPQLSADVTVGSLRVGQASTLDLNARVLTLGGNLDAVGTITGGTVRVTGAGARIGGTLPALEVSGSATLQRPVQTSGAVLVTGALTAADQPLTIAIP